VGRLRLTYPVPLWILLPAALVSGATALVYEIVWARRLALVLGSATSAAAAVLSAFMFGLALGAVLVGRRADASRRPLRWYGLLELGIGVYALAFDPLRDLVSGWFPGQPWLTAFGLLVLPAALMGGTLPVLARAGADSIARGTRAFGSLYGVNTLGAVVGALLASLVLLESRGLAGTTVVAAIVNLVLGAGFWAMSLAAGARQVYEEEAPAAPRRWLGDAEPAVIGAFFLAGFAALALELAWFRLLVYYLEGFTIAFGLMLAAYLAGVGAGALGGTWLAHLAGNPRRLLARTLLVEGILAVLTFLYLTQLGDSLEAMRATYIQADAIDAHYSMALFWAALAVVFPATFCAGMLMPIVSRIALSHRESIGGQTGAVYASSTLGAVLAPPLAAFWLLPAFGVTGTIVGMGALLLLAGTGLALARGLREWVFAGVAAVVFVVVCFAGDLGTPLIERSHVFRAANRHRRLLAYEHGQLGDVSVVEELENGARRLYLDGFSAAETGSQYGYMRMQGHLPVLLHPDPERVLVIAYGTGTTAGAAALHPEVKEVVCVEIEPAVYDVSPLFAAQNRDVLAQEKVRHVVADGREYLGRGEQFDVITLEPLMPYTPAAVYLYTKEFYAKARAALRPGGLGILCQWIPPQGVSGADFQRLVASAAAVFDHVSLWYFPHAVLMLCGDRAPELAVAAGGDQRGFLVRCTGREIQEDLRLASVENAVHLLGAHVCSGDALKQALAGVAPMVDDRTELEFRPLVRGLGRRSVQYHAEVLEFLRDHHQTTVPWLTGKLAGIDEALASGGAVLATLAAEQRARVEGTPLPPASDLDPVLKRDEKALFARTIRDRRRYRELMELGQPEEAAQLAAAPDRSLAYLALADRADGDQRIYYLTLAVGQNALLDPSRPAWSEAQLRDLASHLSGAEQRFCLNRARYLAGEPFEDGEEAVPHVTLPDIVGALEAGDEELARMILERARQADLGDQVDRLAWDWFEKTDDKRAGFQLLRGIGSEHLFRAARRLARSTQAEDLIAVVGYYCARYPADQEWAELCTNADPAVREAAADAAKVQGGPSHLATLARLAGDPNYQVRLSAYISFREIEPRADETGYDPKAPDEKTLKALSDLAAEPRDEKVGFDPSSQSPRRGG